MIESVQNGKSASALFPSLPVNLRHRLRFASRAALAHLGLSALAALGSGFLVFGLWYPYPYSALVGGKDLFLLVTAVDLVTGPLLTLVVFSDRKPRSRLVRDIGVIVLIQISALAYGLHSVMIARPVFLAFEGDRFRVVTIPDIDMAHLDEASEGLRRLSLTGPKPVGAALTKADDPQFVESIRLSMAGLHPSFRPSRWGAYDKYREEVRRTASPLEKLSRRYPQSRSDIDRAALSTGLKKSDLGYLPLIAGYHTDWTVLVSLKDGEPLVFLPLDAW